jgi:uroporphyrin-3 C-methyltransferase
MPSDGDRPDKEKDQETTEDKADELDPLSQPPLTRPPPKPLASQVPKDKGDDDSGSVAAESAQAGYAESATEPSSEADESEGETAASAAPQKPDRKARKEQNAAEKAAAAAPPPKAKGRFMGFLGLLFGLSGLGVAGFLYYELIYLTPEAAVEARLGALEADLAGSRQALDALAESQAQALREFAAEQRRARDASAEEVLDAVNRVSAQAPPSRREWKVAELAYLLRIANHRVLMERDVSGALTLLKAADAILQDLDDFALYRVRAQLADEILALQNVESNDVQGLFLRLEAIKTEISAQSVKLPRFEKDESRPAAEDDAEVGFFTALWEQIDGYMRFRRFDGESVRPLLAPEEEAYLELNLRLMLERAQLAALRREQAVYEQSLQTAAGWIASYLDVDSPGVARSLEELDVLSTVVLDQPLPDISGSLSALKELGEA